MKRHNSLSMSLFDQLGAGIDVVGQVPVPKYHRYSENADTGEIAPAQVPASPLKSLPNNMTDMKFTHSLIKHLDMVYSKMLAGEVAETVADDTIDIAGVPHEQRFSYYNPGHSSVTEST